MASARSCSADMLFGCGGGEGRGGGLGCGLRGGVEAEGARSRGRGGVGQVVQGCAGVMHASRGEVARDKAHE